MILIHHEECQANQEDRHLVLTILIHQEEWQHLIVDDDATYHQLQVNQENRHLVVVIHLHPVVEDHLLPSKDVIAGVPVVVEAVVDVNSKYFG